MKKFIISVLFLLLGYVVLAQETTFEIKINIAYYDQETTQSDKYIIERCVLDICYPKKIKNYPTIIWFHGGGLTMGNKEFPQALLDKGVAIVAVNYRLYPKVNSPKYIEDAAAAVAWVF